MSESGGRRIKRAIQIDMGTIKFCTDEMVKRLKKEGYWVRGVDLKHTAFAPTQADDFVIGDLRDPRFVSNVVFAPNQHSEDDNVDSFDAMLEGVTSEINPTEKQYDLFRCYPVSRIHCIPLSGTQFHRG